MILKGMKTHIKMRLFLKFIFHPGRIYNLLIIDYVKTLKKYIHVENTENATEQKYQTILHNGQWTLTQLTKNKITSGKF